MGGRKASVYTHANIAHTESGDLWVPWHVVCPDSLHSDRCLKQMVAVSC